MELASKLKHYYSAANGLVKWRCYEDEEEKKNGRTLITIMACFSFECMDENAVTTIVPGIPSGNQNNSTFTVVNGDYHYDDSGFNGNGNSYHDQWRQKIKSHRNVELCCGDFIFI